MRERFYQGRARLHKVSSRVDGLKVPRKDSKFAQGLRARTARKDAQGCARIAHKYQKDFFYNIYIYIYRERESEREQERERERERERRERERER